MVEIGPDENDHVWINQHGGANRQVSLPAGIDADIAHLVRTTVAPHGATWTFAAAPVFSAASHELLTKASSLIRPFCVVDGDQIVAGTYERDGGSPVWLCQNRAVAEWVGLALEKWQPLIAERRAPSPSEWKLDARWQTSEEARLRSDLDAVAEERKRVLADFASREGSLQLDVAAAAERADSAERRLLTEQSDKLKAAVIEALRELGFSVEDCDAAKAESEKGELLEDLRVRDSLESDWLALCEVRGYTGGAKVRDFQRIGRFVERHIREHGDPPAARWYVVNQFLERDPGGRDAVLAASREDVEAFGEAGGLVIDTVTLFEVLMMTRSGHIETEDARAIIRSSTGVLALDAFRSSET